MGWVVLNILFFQAEDGIRDFCLFRGLGDVCRRQTVASPKKTGGPKTVASPKKTGGPKTIAYAKMTGGSKTNSYAKMIAGSLIHI